MNVLDTLVPNPVNGVWKTIAQNPLTRDQKAQAILRFIQWQIGSRVLDNPVAIPFVEGTRLLLERGMTGATGNIYAGLHEFEGMSFALHALRPSSWFVDIGANVGMYTVLAGGAAGSSCVAAEPVPATYESLCDNVRLNDLSNRVDCRNVGVGKEKGDLQFTETAKSGGNRVLQEAAPSSGTKVDVTALDTLLKEPTSSDDVLVIKIDVEGWEAAVLEGGKSVLSRSSPTALLVELNGWGERYGFDDNKAHMDLVSKGYTPVNYDPIQRQFEKRNNRCKKGNTIYVNNFGFFRKKVENSRMYKVIGKKI